ncbi:hypothetical protein T484DRAFT_1615514 [Baffinella frigidus]|nr:hypothetical protein T484DRAFT_1615514 [Cryptophyta sp. CCMP2293]
MHHTPYTIHHTPYTIHHTPYTITFVTQVYMSRCPKTAQRCKKHGAPPGLAFF